MHTLHPCHRCRNLPLPCSQAAAEQNHPVNTQDLAQCVPGNARQLCQPCVHTRSHHQGGWISSEIHHQCSQAYPGCWIWGLGTLPPMQQQAPTRFPFGGKRSLSHLQMVSWTHICSTVEPDSSFVYKHMYSDPVPLISISSLHSYLASLRYFLSSWAHTSYSLHFLTLQRTQGEHLSPVLCLTCCAHVSFGRTQHGLPTLH